MKSLLVFIMVSLGASLNVVIAQSTHKWLITKESELYISGSSNVNNFKCMALSYAGNDTLYEKWGSAHKLKLMNGKVTLHADNFDCQNKMITRDFRRTLNADEYPKIIVRFHSLVIKPGVHKQQAVNGCVNITLAGVTKEYNIKSQFTTTSNNGALLQGHTTVNLSDFGLTARSKFLGMIRVEDQVTVDFNLVIKAI